MRKAVVELEADVKSGLNTTAAAEEAKSAPFVAVK
jgi:hypothetical protein